MVSLTAAKTNRMFSVSVGGFKGQSSVSISRATIDQTTYYIEETTVHAYAFHTLQKWFIMIYLVVLVD